MIDDRWLVSLTTSRQSHIQTCLFADDCIMYGPLYEHSDYVVLQQDLDALAEWESKSGMEFHPQKCSVLSVSRSRPPSDPFSFFLYILPGARFRALSAGVHCTLRVAGWKPTSNHIEITVGFFNLHRGWLSLHRGHPVNVLIRRTMHLSSVIPANDTRESVFGHRNFSRHERESNLGPLAPEASA